MVITEGTEGKENKENKEDGVRPELLRGLRE